MSPIAPSAVSDAQPVQLQRRSSASQFRDQWWNPSDIFSLLLIIGPDIIQAALAQQAGYLITPTVFSFGWVAYAFNSLLAVFGDTSMLPNPDFQVQIVNARFRHVLENKSWIIGRILRDQEFRDQELQDQKLRDQNLLRRCSDRTDWNGQKRDFQISFFRFKDDANAGEIKRDFTWFSGFPVMLIQLVVSIVPIIIKGNWAPVIVTAGGTILALFHGAIPQWKREKWALPISCGSTVSMTQGNGSRYVMVIFGKEHESREGFGGLDIEFLASGSKRKLSWRSRAASVILAVLWTVLLISVTGLEEDTWCKSTLGFQRLLSSSSIDLMGVGLIGMIHSIYVAGAARSSDALGVHLVKEEPDIISPQIYDALKEAEGRYKNVGSSLIGTFFPGGMRIPADDVTFWDNAATNCKLHAVDQLNITVEE